MEKSITRLIGRFQIKKIVACLLVLVLMSSTGLSAFAAPAGSEGGTGTSSYQAELMQLLEQEYGVDQAPAVMETLKQLGLVDSNGELVTVPIYMNGESYTLDEVMQLIADENTDLTQIAEVDGRQISLSDLKKMIEIEASIAEMTQNDDLADPTITSGHLDSLESLFTQAGSEGFGFYDEAGNLLGDTAASTLTTSSAHSLNASAGNNELAEAEAYQDATYIAVTNYEINTASNPVITFELHRAQNDPGTAPISFDYGFIEGTLGSVATSDYVGTVTFNPSDPTTQTIELQTSSDFNGTCYPFKQLYYNGCNGSGAHGIIDNLEYFQEGYARADYIHFYNFKNLDFINLDRIDSDSFTSFQQFHHTYNGGAYLAFASRFLSDEGVTVRDFNIGDWNYPDFTHKPILTFFVFGNGYKHAGNSTYRNIYEVEAPGGSYTTGQMLPIQVKFGEAVMTVPAGGLEGEMARVDLENGLVASPAIIVPSTPKWGGWGATSHKLDYQAVLDKSTIEAYQQAIKDQVTYTGLYPDWIQAGDLVRKYW